MGSFGLHPLYHFRSLRSDGIKDTKHFNTNQFGINILIFITQLIKFFTEITHLGSEASKLTVNIQKNCSLLSVNE